MRSYLPHLQCFLWFVLSTKITNRYPTNLFCAGQATIEANSRKRVKKRVAARLRVMINDRQRKLEDLQRDGVLRSLSQEENNQQPHHHPPPDNSVTLDATISADAMVSPRAQRTRQALTLDTPSGGGKGETLMSTMTRRRKPKKPRSPLPPHSLGLAGMSL